MLKHRSTADLVQMESLRPQASLANVVLLGRNRLTIRAICGTGISMTRRSLRFRRDDISAVVTHRKGDKEQEKGAKNCPNR